MTHDIIIIGAGPGGYETAVVAAGRGHRVALIERGELGGTCLNRGCIPTKTLCRSAEVAVTVREAAAYGVELSDDNPVINYAAVADRKDAVVSQLREGVAQLLKGVDVIKGEASLVSPAEISVDGTIYSAPRIIIATGSAPARLPIPGAELAMTSDELLSMTSLPSSIVIIGAGVIGLEFASVLNAFGVKVTVVEFCREVLPPFDAEVAKRLRMSLKRRGIDILTDTRVTAIEAGMKVMCEAKGKMKTLEAEAVLMAVGRRPVLPPGLESLGIALNRGAIVVDDDMKVQWEGEAPENVTVYAIGDVNGRCMLAHAATAQGEIVLGEKRDLDVIPSAVFTMPECAMVGLTEEQCATRGLDIKVGKATFRANGKAVAMGETDGMVKVISNASTGRMLGCHICGPHAADLIQEAATVMSASLPAAAIADAIHSHPTLGETLRAAIVR